MTTRPTTAGAVAASLAIGGVAGATLFAPQLIGAQEEAPAEDPATDETTVDEQPADKGPRGRMGGKLDALSELLGVTPDELKTALMDGQSIADIAEANGVDPQAVIDELTEQARAQMEERLAALPEHIEDFVNGEFEGRGTGIGDRQGFGGRRGPFGGHPHGPEAESTDGD